MKHDRTALELERETQAASAVREALLRVPGVTEDDSETLADTIEGETNLRELIARVVALLTDTEIMLVGIDNRLEVLEARKHRLTERKAYLRSIIEQAMFIGEIKYLELPDATLVLSRRAGGVVIVEESKIPAGFWKQPDPVLDKALLSAALKEGHEVPGATLGNGSVSLTVKRT